MKDTMKDYRSTDFAGEIGTQRALKRSKGEFLMNIKRLSVGLAKTSLWFAIAFGLMIQSAFAMHYEYDSLHRLTKVIHEDGTVLQYSYDAVGNRIRKAVPSPTPTDTPTPTKTPTYTITSTLTDTNTPADTPTNTATE